MCVLYDILSNILNAKVSSVNVKYEMLRYHV